jgi:hypothetical protein
MVNKFARSMTVENLDYTTILEVKTEDEIALRAKLFLDTLSKEYKNFNLQSEYDINDNTLKFIDKQLDEVTVVLNEYEDQLQNYMEGKAILDLSKEEDRYFAELVRFDNLKRKYELMIQTVDQLEEYVLNIDDRQEKLLPPSFYILEDDAFLKTTLGQLYDMQMSRNVDLYDASENNPGVQKTDATMQLTRSNLLVYLKNTREAITQKIGDVSVQIADYERMIRGVPRNKRDILNIERKLQVNEKLYVYLLEKRANTIIAYTYQEELAELKRRFPHAKTMDDPNIIEHWNAGQVELLLAHPKSAGHGLNLQHGGCHMVFLSLPWSLELYEQTVGRLHRSGQTKDVWVYVMLTEKSIDERIWAALHDKRAVSDIALEELKNE